MSNGDYLVVIETRKVKGYLLASRHLRETRGASFLLDKLNRIMTKGLLKGKSGYEEIYIGGGSGRIVFEKKDDAEDFAKEVKNLYRKETGGARVSVEVVKRDKENKENFAAWMSRGVRESKKNKIERAETSPVPSGRWIRPCSSCGMSPAEKFATDVQGAHLMCKACSIKRQEVKGLYAGLKCKALTSAEAQKYPGYIITDLISEVQCRHKKDTVLPQDFDDIADRSRPKNYIGFIYADGNRMGEIIKALGKKNDDENAKTAYKAFSEIVDRATRKAAVDAVLKCVKPEIQNNGVLIPAEFVMAGGDDLILVVPAHTALDVAANFIEKFQEYTIELQTEYVGTQKLQEPFAEKGLTISAGVVLAHASYPASELMDLAGDLMKMAKKKAAYMSDDSLEGTLDFMVVHAPGSEKVKERRKNEYTKTINSLHVSLTERPYTAKGCLKLLETIKAFKKAGVPTTKLKALYSVIFQGVLQAQFDALRIRERLKVTGALDVNAELEKFFGELNCFPFRKEEGKDGLTTPLSELVEIFDFVHCEVKDA